MPIPPTPWPILPCSSIYRKTKLPSFSSVQLSCERPGADCTPRQRHSFLTASLYRAQPRRAAAYAIETFRNVFTEALLLAGRCQQHQSRQLSSLRRGISGVSPRAQRQQGQKQMTRALHNSSPVCAPTAAVAYEPSREELIGLMDYYHSEDAPQSLTATKTRKPTQSFTEDHDFILNALQKLQKESDGTQSIVARLERLLHDRSTPPDNLIQTYCELPSPGAARLSDQTILTLLNRLSVLPHKSEHAMLRYLHIITDMRSAGKYVPISAWTSAIAFAGRCFKRISTTELENALTLWKQMESQAGLRANEVTFNVLIDIAAKARKFVLVEMLSREMRERGHRMDRYARTSLMYYYGLRGDGAGVRRAYRDLVEAGEVIDTTVMSCAVASLLKAGEPVAAEQVFERAKRLHAEKGGASPLPPHGWREQRELGRNLNATAAKFRTNPRRREDLQNRAPLAPGVQVYKVLIYHYAVKVGDINRVSALVDEMSWYKIPIQGAIFLYLFKGFAIHGGLLYSGWTRRKLEMTFAAFIGAVEDERMKQSRVLGHKRNLRTTTSALSGKAGEEQPFTEVGGDSDNIEGASAMVGAHEELDPVHEVYISKAAVELSLSAFVRVVDTARAGEVWAQLQSLWLPHEGDREAVEGYLIQLEIRKQQEELCGPLKGSRARRRHFWLR